MGKFRIGELVCFREAELELSALPELSVKLKTENLSGKVTGVFDCGPAETNYIDVTMPIKGEVINVTVNESQIMSSVKYASNVIGDMIKEAEEFKRMLANRSSLKPYHSYIFSDFAFPMTKDKIEEYEKKINEYARNIMKGVDPAVPGGDKSSVSVFEKKMSKPRCIKLLECYRAEREKVKKGRKFERCLRDSVVDEALERAIELLKGGEE